MNRTTIIDASVIVALLDERDYFHHWAVREWATIQAPLLTCDAVITESCYLLRNVHEGKEAVISLVKRQIIQVSFNLNEEAGVIETLMRRYRSVPMSFADACLVRMSEQILNSIIMTLDSDFKIYRKYRNQEIPVIMPKF
jgi:predicted nucleic acid-binding protein